MGALIKIPAIRIFRTFVVAHPELIFLYGQDYGNRGALGQAWQVANEPNSFPVPTLYKLCNSTSDKYFYDDQFEQNKQKIDERISQIPRDGRPIIPLQKIGRGHSLLFQKAPKTYEYLMNTIGRIAYPNIELDWQQQMI